MACSQPANTATQDGDCDDSNNTVYPGAPEICDDLDNDCNNLVDSDDPNYVDTTPPALTCPGTQTLVIAGASAPLPDYTDLATADDACGTPVLTQSPATGAVQSGSGPLTVMITAADAAGNSASCSFTVEKIESVPLSIECNDHTVTFNGEPGILLKPEDLVQIVSGAGIQEIVLSPAEVTCEQIGSAVEVFVTVRDNNGAEETCSSTVTITGFPCNWMEMTNGIGCVNGSESSYDAGTGTFSLTATGCYTPGYTTDENAFIKFPLCGDGSITAHIAGLTLPGFAGITMRETDQPGSKKVALVYQGGNTVARYVRYTTNGAAFPSYLPTPGSTWFRIIRTGNLFQGYHSANGVYWILAFSYYVDMNDCILAGLIVSGMTSNGVVTATFDNVTIEPPFGGVQRMGVHPGAAQALTTPDIAVWPNPTDGRATILFSDGWGDQVTVEVRDGLGQLVRNAIADREPGIFTAIDLGNHAPGLYFIRVRDVTRRTSVAPLVITRN